MGTKATKTTKTTKARTGQKSAIITIEMESRFIAVKIAMNPKSSAAERAEFSQRLIKDAEDRVERSFKALALAG